MKRTLLLLAAVLLAACQNETSQPVAAKTPATSTAGKRAVAPDVPARLAQLPRTTIDYDRALLNDEERNVVAKLIEASKLIDELYWRQVAAENPAVRAEMEKQASASP